MSSYHARVKTRALGEHLVDKVFRVVDRGEVDGLPVYYLDVTPLGQRSSHERRIYPFSACEVTILREAS